jgi:hypothetical protein
VSRKAGSKAAHLSVEPVNGWEKASITAFSAVHSKPALDTAQWCVMKDAVALEITVDRTVVLLAFGPHPFLQVQRQNL